jgi:site-specific recombinase XerC
MGARVASAMSRECSKPTLGHAIRVLLRLLYAAGLRVSEACRLRWRNLRPCGDTGQITVFGKNGRTRAIALPAALWSELTALRGGAAAEGLVFPSRNNKHLDRGRVLAGKMNISQMQEAVKLGAIIEIDYRNAFDEGAFAWTPCASSGPNTASFRNFGPRSNRLRSTGG